MLFLAAHSRNARVTLRNAVETHEGVVVRRFGRAVLLEETMYAAFLACRLRAEFGTALQVERTVPFLAQDRVPEAVRSAAEAYADRAVRSTPYAAFAAGTSHPDPEDMKGADL